MHSSRMHTVHCSGRLSCQACPPACHMWPPKCTPPSACPPTMHATCHACPPPCMSPHICPLCHTHTNPFTAHAPFAMHAPLHHACLPFTMHIPLCHECTPTMDGMTDDITFPQLLLRTVMTFFD